MNCHNCGHSPSAHPPTSDIISHPYSEPCIRTIITKDGKLTCPCAGWKMSKLAKKARRNRYIQAAEA